MTNSHKERIEDLETNVEEIKEEIQKLNVDVADKFKSIEEALHRLTESVMVGRDGGDASATRSTARGTERSQQLQAVQTEAAKPLATGRPVKLELPRFKGGDPTAWISKAKQYFGYHSIPEDQQVGFASYNLEDEANEWWQATAKTSQEDVVAITWPVFEGELRVRFGPTEGEEFDEALSKKNKNKNPSLIVVENMATRNGLRRKKKKKKKKREKNKMNRRKVSSNHDWSKLCPDVLRKIFETLESPIDSHRAKSVCSDWYSVWKTCVNKPPCPWRIIHQGGDSSTVKKKHKKTHRTLPQNPLYG